MKPNASPPPFDTRVQRIIQGNESRDTFSVAAVPGHVHNGVDSQQVPFLALSGKFIMPSFTIPGTSAATATNYSVFFLAPYAMNVLGVQEVHTTKGSDAGAVTLQVEKLTTTGAPGTGTSVLTAGFNLKATENTVQTGVLDNLITSRQLAAGDRLAFVLTGTPTAVANVTVSVVLGF